MWASTALLVTAVLVAVDVDGQEVMNNSLGCPYLDQFICPDNQNMNMTLYTRWDSEATAQYLVINLETIDLATISRLRPGNPTKIITHGLDSSASVDYLVSLRDEYLKRQQYNVFMVDWSQLAAGVTCYELGATLDNAHHVGNCVGELVAKLNQIGNTDIHLIGQSVGAHLMSFAANKARDLLNIVVPRITGLDPAGPNYSTLSGDLVLDKTDATYVDAYHTNPGLLGIGKNVGTLDVYVNFGPIQPGCQNIFKAPVEASSCSHGRSAWLFAESVNTATGFYVRPCWKFSDWLNTCFIPKGRCNILVGANVATSTTGTVSLYTLGRSPYALGRIC